MVCLKSSGTVFLLVMPKYWGKQFSASYVLQTPPRMAHAKLPGPKKRPKICNNKGQLRIATPPRLAHAKSPEVTTTKLAYNF